MKYCPACKTDKPEEDFYADRHQSCGLSSNCKTCKNARSRKYWKEAYYPDHREEQIKKVIARKKR